jgi:hypothetical protein
VHLRCQAWFAHPSSATFQPTGWAQVEGVYKLKGSEGFGNWWATIDPQHWKSVRSLNLSYCGLAVLPAAIGGLGATLKVRGPQLKRL